MASRKYALPAAAGATALAGVMFYSTSNKNPQKSESRNQGPGKPERPAAAQMRDEGISGAGVAGTATTGGHDRPQPSGDKDNPNRGGTNSTAPLEKLPAGGVGGGAGGGGMNKRTLEMTSNKQAGQNYGTDSSHSSKSTGGGQDSDSNTGPLRGSDKSAPSQSSEGRSFSQRLQGVFGQGGQAAQDQENVQNKKRYDDPRVHSHDTAAPSKKNDGGKKNIGE